MIHVFVKNKNILSNLLHYLNQLCTLLHYVNICLLFYKEILEVIVFIVHSTTISPYMSPFVCYNVFIVIKFQVKLQCISIQTYITIYIPVKLFTENIYIH